MGERRRLALAFAILLPLALLPVLLPFVPPFFDVPNHLARVVILSRYDESEFYRSFYETNWRVIPNLALDVALLGLCRIFAPLVALKIYLAAIVVLTVAGFAAFHRQIHGRSSPVALGGFALVYTLSMFMGFMNFSMGLALLMLLGSTYLALRRRSAPVRVGLAALVALVLFFTHLLAFLFALLFLAFIAPATVTERPPRRTLLELAFVALVPIGLYALTSPTRGETGGSVFRSPLYKVVAVGNLYRSGVVAVDLLAVPLLLLGFGLLMLGSRDRLARWAKPLLAVVAVIFLAAPFGTLTTSVLDSRLPVFLAMGGLLALGEIPFDRRLARWGAVSLGCGVVTQFVGLSIAYRANDGDARDLVRFYDAHPARAYVVQAVAPAVGRLRVGPFEQRNSNRAGLSVLSGERFATGLFGIPNQQPMTYRDSSAPLRIVANVPNEPESLARCFDDLRRRARMAGNADLTIYVQLALPDSQLPVPVAGSELLVARHGVGVYRL